MTATESTFPSFATVRPLVRYVDDEQAVIEVHFLLRPQVAIERRTSFPRYIDVLLQVSHADGFNDEEQIRVPLGRGAGVVTMRLVRPARWWPVGMGEQPLYDLQLTLLRQKRTADTWKGSIGLTSVRPEAAQSETAPAHLLINGQLCQIRSLMPIDAPDERGFLPVAGNSLLVIRGHYGPDVLFNAADRAGILLLQCVPVDSSGTPDSEVEHQIDRLAAHPSLAGWYVGHLGSAADAVTHRIRTLDPTHCIFQHLPQLDAA